MLATERRYFDTAYEYDYETEQRMSQEAVDYLSSYRLLTEKTGVCQEISTAYSYLLMQVGVDATIMMGQSEFQNSGHQWSYVRINGHNYHIDPTYALGSGVSLEYFMMTDEKRSEEYLPENYVIASCYSQEHEHQLYVADDDTFAPLWGTWLDSFDHDTHTITCHTYDENGNPVRKTFDYEGF